MRKLTQERLKELLDYDPLTGIFNCKVTRGSKAQKGEVAGSMRPNGYITISIDYKHFLAHRLAWLYCFGYFPDQIDHIDQNKSNNMIGNLREISNQDNHRNCNNYKSNTSGVKGVSWHKQRKKWCAKVKVNFKHKSLGLHVDFNDAVCARLAGEQCIGWEYSDSNSPAFKYVKQNINGDAK